MASAQGSLPRHGPAVALPLQNVLYARLRELTPSIFDVDTPTPDHMGRDQAVRFELEQLPYNLGATHHALLRLEQELRALTSAIPEIGSSARCTYFVGDERRLPIAWTVDTFLDAGRRTQNSLTRYIARAFRTSVPASLSTLVGDTAKYARKVPADVLDLISRYWDGAGNELKAYRDLAQHYTIVSSDIYVTQQPAGGLGIQLLLPSSTDERALQRISYGPPYVQAGVWCRAAFMSLFEVAYSLQYLLFRRFEYSERAISDLIRHPMSFNATDAFSDPPDANLDEQIWALRARLKPSLETKHGALNDPPIVDR